RPSVRGEAKSSGSLCPPGKPFEMNDFLKIPVETRSWGEVLQKIKEKHAQGGLILSLNPEIFYLIQQDDFLRTLYQKSFLNLPDGVGIVWAMRWLQGQKIQRLAGVELIEKLFETW